MSRVWVVALVLLAVAAPAARSEVRADPLLGLTFAGGSTTLVRLDPATLRPLADSPRLATRGYAYAWSFSPDRSRLVLGGARGTLLIVDPARFRKLATIDCGVSSPPAATIWFGDRLFAVFSSGLVREIDLERNRATGSRLVGRGLYGVERTKAGIVMLVGPPRGIGPARLAVVDTRLRVRSVRLERITAGLRIDRDAETFEQRHPGLAVDAETGRAFAVAGGAPIAVVSLKTLAVTYRRPALAATVDAARKVANGPRREVRLLPDGKLAISGLDQYGTVDTAGHVQSRTEAAGAVLVDPATWAGTMLDAEATATSESVAGLLTWGIAPGPQRPAGSGLRLHGPDGERFHLFGTEAIWLVRTAGSRAVVARAGRSGYDVVDLEAGAVVGHRAGEPPMPLSGSFQEFGG